MDTSKPTHDHENIKNKLNTLYLVKNPKQSIVTKLISTLLLNISLKPVQN